MGAEGLCGVWLAACESFLLLEWLLVALAAVCASRPRVVSVRFRLLIFGPSSAEY